MTTANWRTNLGGAIGVTGTGLIGIGVLTQLSQLSPKTNMLSDNQLAAMWYVALAGFILSCVGRGITALFAADAKQLEINHQQTVAAINEIKQQTATAVKTGDTSFLTKPTVIPTVDNATKTA